MRKKIPSPSQIHVLTGVPVTTSDVSIPKINMALGFDAFVLRESKALSVQVFSPMLCPRAHSSGETPPPPPLGVAGAASPHYRPPALRQACTQNPDAGQNAAALRTLLALRYPGVDTPQSELRQFRGSKSVPPPRGGSGGPVCVSPRLVRTPRGLASAGNAKASPGPEGAPAAREKARAPPRRLTQEGGRNRRRLPGVERREGEESWCNAAQCDRTERPGGGGLRPELGRKTSARLGPEVGKARLSFSGRK